ncbi:MAG: hypothetical protein J7M24_06805 [Candidatus Latescibacteria bacterium]|nr:hypothetical protein [Candidatus Latescibacterota bacterium]
MVLSKEPGLGDRFITTIGYSAQMHDAGKITVPLDIYEALRSKRSYKPAFSHEKALNILREGDTG